MKILLVDYEISNSCENGDQQRWWKLYNHLSKTNEVKVVVNPSQGSATPPQDWWIFDKSMRISDELVEKYKQSCTQLYEDDEIYNPNFPSDAQLTVGLENWFCPLNFIEFYRQKVEEFQPDVVIFKYMFFRRLLSVTPAGVKTLVDSPISFHQKAINNAAVNFHGDPGISFDQEKNMLKNFDMLSFSHPEERYLFENLGKPSCVFFTTQPEITEINEPSEPTILFIGGNQAMNSLYLNGFIKHSWTKIKHSIPEAKLLVVGAVQTPDSVPGLEKIAHTSDLKAVYDRATICINPVKPGAGTKTKVLEAISYKKPIVTMSNHVDNVVGKTTALMAQNWPDFVNGCIGLLQSKTAREYIVSESAHFWRKWLSEDNCYKSLEKLLYESKNN